MSEELYGISPELSRDGIAELLPHAGAMVLIDRVGSYSVESILCFSNVVEKENPLAVEGEVGIYSGVEYAAQAMALHSTLSSSGGKAEKGVVAVVSKLEAYSDVLKGVIEVRAEKIDFTGDSSLYDFTVLSRDQLVLSGRMLVLLQKDM